MQKVLASSLTFVFAAFAATACTDAAGPREPARIGDASLTSVSGGGGAPSVQLAPPVSLQASLPTGLRVLIYDTDAGADVAVRDALVATGMFAASDITLLEMTDPPPLLSNFTGNQCVLAYTNFVPPNPTAQGDRLKEYVDAGGTLVLMVGVYGMPAVQIGGGVMGPGYSPLTPTGVSHGVFSTRSLNFGTALTTHPLMSGVLDFTYSSNPLFSEVDLAAGATLVARENTGGPLVAVNAAGNVFGIAAYPNIGAAVPVLTPGVYQMIANACASTAFGIGGGGFNYGRINGFGTMSVPAGSVTGSPLFAGDGTVAFFASQFPGGRAQGTLVFQLPNFTLTSQNLSFVRTRFTTRGASGIFEGQGMCTGGQCFYRVTVADPHSHGSTLLVKSRDAVRVEVWRRNPNGTPGQLLIDTERGSGYGSVAGVLNGSAVISLR